MSAISPEVMSIVRPERLIHYRLKSYRAELEPRNLRRIFFTIDSVILQQIVPKSNGKSGVRQPCGKVPHCRVFVLSKESCENVCAKGMRFKMLDGKHNKNLELHLG